MHLVHYGDLNGGGIIITPALSSDVKKLEAFLRNELKLDVQRLPRRAPRKSGIWLGRWVLPPARTTNRTLITPASVYPCKLCEFANYNQLCQHQKNCVLFAYWTIRSAQKMPAVRMSKLSHQQNTLVESIVAKFIEATESKDENKRQNTPARISKNRSNKNKAKKERGKTKK